MAREYGCSPSQVKEWTRREFQEAVMILSAESRAGKKTPDDIESEQKERRKQMAEESNGFILGISYPYWKKFIHDNVVDWDGIRADGFNDDQHPGIEELMLAGGLLKPAGEYQSLASEQQEGEA